MLDKLPHNGDATNNAMMTTGAVISGLSAGWNWFGGFVSAGVNWFDVHSGFVSSMCAMGGLGIAAWGAMRAKNKKSSDAVEG